MASTSFGAGATKSGGVVAQVVTAVEAHATQRLRAHLERSVRGTRRSDVPLLRPTWIADELLACPSPEPAFFAHCLSQLKAEDEGAEVYWAGTAAPCLDGCFALKSVPGIRGRISNAKAWSGRSELEMPIVIFRCPVAPSQARREAALVRCLHFVMPEAPHDDSGGVRELSLELDVNEGLV